MTYHIACHFPQETYPSFHYTSLVYLNDYGHDFQGGRFIFNDRDANRTVQPKTGESTAPSSPKPVSQPHRPAQNR